MLRSSGVRRVTPAFVATQFGATRVDRAKGLDNLPLFEAEHNMVEHARQLVARRRPEPGFLLNLKSDRLDPHCVGASSLDDSAGRRSRNRNAGQRMLDQMKSTSANGSSISTSPSSSTPPPIRSSELLRPPSCQDGSATLETYNSDWRPLGSVTVRTGRNVTWEQVCVIHPRTPCGVPLFGSTAEQRKRDEPSVTFLPR